MFFLYASAPPFCVKKAPHVKKHLQKKTHNETSIPLHKKAIMFEYLCSYIGR